MLISEFMVMIQSLTMIDSANMRGQLHSLSALPAASNIRKLVC